MSNLITNTQDTKEIIQATSIKMQAYNMKMEMVAGANLVEEAIDLVGRYQVLYLKEANKYRTFSGITRFTLLLLGQTQGTATGTFVGTLGLPIKNGITHGPL